MLLLTESTTGQAWEPFQSGDLWEIGALNGKVLSRTFKGYTYLPTNEEVTMAE